MKIVRRIAGKTLMDRERSNNIRQTCGINEINNWILDKKKKWNERIDHMTKERIVKITRDKLPAGRRSTGIEKDGETTFQRIRQRQGCEEKQAICLYIVGRRRRRRSSISCLIHYVYEFFKSTYSFFDIMIMNSLDVLYLETVVHLEKWHASNFSAYNQLVHTDYWHNGI